MLEESKKRVQRLESRDTKSREFLSVIQEQHQAREDKLHVIIA